MTSERLTAMAAKAKTSAESEARMAKHTPGPLSVVDGRKFGSKDILVTCQIDGGSIPIAAFHFTTGYRDVELPALENAALFASAPALIAERNALREALEALADRVELCGKESQYIFGAAAIHGIKYNGPDWVDELARARRALRGEV